MPTGDMWGPGPDRLPPPHNEPKVGVGRRRNERKVRKVWTIVFGILLAIQVIDDVGPHTKNNPLSSNIHATIFFGLVIFAIQWRAVKRHTRIGLLSQNTLRWAGGIFGVLVVLYLISTPTTPSHLAPTASTSSSSVAIARPVTVSVVKSGFTQSAGNLISYGLILRNNNSSLTALDVKVTTTFLDSLGRSVGTDDQTITGIPPTGNFNIGGSIAPNVSLTVAKLRVAVKVGGSTAEQLILPLATNVTATTRDFSDSVIGNLRNPYSRLLPSDATIYIVYLNTQGQIVGGDNESTGAAVNPGATVAFSDTLLSMMTISKTTIVRASVDPYGFPVPGSGKIQWTSP